MQSSRSFILFTAQSAHPSLCLLSSSSARSAIAPRLDQRWSAVWRHCSLLTSPSAHCSSARSCHARTAARCTRALSCLARPPNIRVIVALAAWVVAHPHTTQQRSEQHAHTQNEKGDRAERADAHARGAMQLRNRCAIEPAHHGVGYRMRCAMCSTDLPHCRTAFSHRTGPRRRNSTASATQQRRAAAQQREESHS